jgi:hypothetical protein
MEKKFGISIDLNQGLDTKGTKTKMRTKTQRKDLQEKSTNKPMSGIWLACSSLDIKAEILLHCI